MLRALAKGAAAIALGGGALVASVGAASAAETGARSINDCRDFAEQWGIDEESPSYESVHEACREGAWYGAGACHYWMHQAIWQHNEAGYRYVPHWVGDEACSRAD